ncbi:MAG TPA: OB-fold nucleic acid binding domain-containing protein, partial [Zeimonas sp.]
HTAWLKACHPAEYMAATLSADMDDTDKVKLFVDDARANGVELLPPDVNASQYRFEPVGGRTIRYGLGAIKGTGEGAVVEILRARSEKAFTDLFDFCARVDRRIVNRRAIEALVRAGAFDSLDSDRARLLANVGRAMDAAEAAGAAVDQVSLFGDETGLPSAPEWIDAPAWSERRRLQEEKAALGLFLSGHLFHAHEDEVRSFVRLRLADVQPAAQPVWIAGIVAAQRTQMTRRGKMAFVTLDDATATIEVCVFNELYEANRRLIRDDELVVVLGTCSRDDYSGGQRVVAERLLDLERARREFGKRLRIRLGTRRADGGALRGAIEPFVTAGDETPAIPVVVEYGNRDAACEVELGPNWRVRPHDDLIGAIRSMLRPLAAEVEY